MAKEIKQEQKTSLYLLAIVAIVAIVGIVVLILNSSSYSYTTAEYETVSDEDSDLVGMASGGPARMKQPGGSGTSCSSHSDCRGGWCSGGKCV